MPRQSKPTFQTENQVFPTRLRELMELEDVTQAQLGEAIGVRRQTISLYTTGQSKPDWEQIAKICNFLHCSSDYLLGMSDYRNVEDKAFSDSLYDELSSLLGRLFDGRDQERVKSVLQQVIEGFKAASWCDYGEYCIFESAALNITLAMKSIAQCLGYVHKKDLSSLNQDEKSDLAQILTSIVDEATNSILTQGSRFSGKYNEHIIALFPSLLGIEMTSTRFAHKISAILSDEGIVID